MITGFKIKLVKRWEMKLSLFVQKLTYLENPGKNQLQNY